MGGLITLAESKDVPEGASPRCQDVDFLVGSVCSRDGLRSFFTYATTLQITGFSLGSGGLATFTYNGPEPTINEGFTLGGFLGALSVLNGQVVYVEAVTLNTFMAIVVNGPILTVSGLTANGVSSTGQFLGPNQGSNNTSTSWTAPVNITSPTLYASVSSGIAISESLAPTVAANSGTGTAWATPGNLLTTGASFATVALTPSTVSELLAGSSINLAVPSSATITGVAVSVQGKYVGTGNGQIVLGLASGITALGNFTVPMSSTLTPITKGSAAYQWGTTLTPTQVNNTNFSATLLASTTGTGTFSVNKLVVTVYYTEPLTSGALLSQNYSFVVSISSGVSGFVTSFKAYSSANTTAIFQLLQNGIPEGLPKTVQLTTVPTVYQLGGPEDPWGYPWSAANVNSATFGIQITASGTGITYVGDLDITANITPALENFNWVGSYEQNNMALTTLALDAAGNMWKEDVINNPGVLSLALSGIIPNSFAVGATMNNSEFVMFSDLTIGTDRPRQLFSDGNWYPVTQVGPGVAPKPVATTGSISGTLSLTSYSQAGAVGTFNFTTVAVAPVQDSLYVIAGTGTALDGQVVIVLAGSTTSQFTAKVTGTIPNGSYTGTATPQFFYAISSITQIPADGSGNPYIHQAPQLGFLLGTGPGQGGTGTNVTVWYNIYGFPAWSALLTAMANTNVATYIQITGAASVGGHNFNGIWQVTATGAAHYPGTSDTGAYLCFTYTQSGAMGYTNAAGASIFLTAATMTLATPVESFPAGTQFTITGATPSGWNNTWTISQALNGGQFDIDTTAYDVATGLITYQYHQAGTSAGPATAGQLVRIQNCTNNAAFNGTFVIATGGASTFTVSLIPALAASVPQASDNQGIATMFGTKFTFDPGETFYTGQSSTTNVNYGTDTNTGQITIIGSTFTPIGSGTRQIMCFFITKTGEWTPASPPFTFDVPTNANLLNISGIPIGPPDTVARGIAITEAGQNGVPGANFYVIVNPVTLTVSGVTNTYTSTIINNNTDTSASFSFTDAVLLDSQEVDIPGFNLFNLIELGSCGWCVPYSSRMFYGMQLNKVQNFNNLTFDGGYTAPNQPAGWGLYLTANEIALVPSPVTGDALYISNTTGSVQAKMGMMVQTAYQDPFNVAIIASNTAYSVRVTASCPSGVRLGNLVIDLTDISGGVFGTTYGSFTVPLSSMVSLPLVFSGPLLNLGVFTGNVSANLNLRVWVQNMGIGADVLVDRIEVFPTAFPYLKTSVYGSYVGKPEWVDASPDGGIIETATENPQTCFGGCVLRDSLYLLKSASMYVTKDNPNSEPGGWSLNEVSARAGSCGINAFDSGDEWLVTACRTGIYAFDGRKPTRIIQEIFQLWDAINWNAGNTIVLRNDMENRRIICAIPLPTGTSPEGVPTATVKWLPYAPYNPAPTTPNVMLMCNYQAFASFEELVDAPEMHTTMFGTLAVQDMKRKWTIWQIPTPYMGRVLRGNYMDEPLMICNGIESSKIYELDPLRHDDDGTAIYSLYCGYGFVNAAKAVTMPIFGMHAKRYTILQFTAEGSGKMQTKMYPNTLNARYPYTVPVGINLAPTEQDDFYRNLNVKGNRMFVEVSTNAVGDWFHLHKMLLTGKADNWSTLPATGGGNAGII